MTGVIPVTAAGEIKLTAENKCRYCKGKTCCTYLTQHIAAPRSREDFDLMLWQIAHHAVQFFKDEDGWFLLINTPCRHLLPDGRCGIYDRRPQICREYSNDDCEFDGPCGEDDYELFFPDYESLLAYCRQRFKNWDARTPSARARRPVGRNRRKK